LDPEGLAPTGEWKPVKGVKPRWKRSDELQFDIKHQKHWCLVWVERECRECHLQFVLDILIRSRAKEYQERLYRRESQRFRELQRAHAEARRQERLAEQQAADFGFARRVFTGYAIFWSFFTVWHPGFLLLAGIHYAAAESMGAAEAHFESVAREWEKKAEAIEMKMHRMSEREKFEERWFRTGRTRWSDWSDWEVKSSIVIYDIVVPNQLCEVFGARGR